MEKVDWIWLNGNFIPWKDGQVHLMTHSLHYGVAAFEGIRCYEQSRGGAAIFRLSEHLNRLYDSAKICVMEVPHAKENLLVATRELVRKNRLLDGCYIRPMVFMGEGAMGIAAPNNPIQTAMMAWRWGAYLGEEGVRNGIRAKVSSFRRPRGDSMLAKGKITGQYVNSYFAKREALLGGYQEAIFLDAEGFVCEASGENIFLVDQKGQVRTPDTSEAILAGITRDTVIQLLADEGIEVRTGRVARDELYSAQEVFLTGTAAEITPVREVDNRSVGAGKPGPLTQKLQATFRKLVRGESDKHREWLTEV